MNEGKIEELIVIRERQRTLKEAHESEMDYLKIIKRTVDTRIEALTMLNKGCNRRIQDLNLEINELLGKKG